MSSPEPMQVDANADAKDEPPTDRDDLRSPRDVRQADTQCWGRKASVEEYQESSDGDIHDVDKWNAWEDDGSDEEEEEGDWKRIDELEKILSDSEHLSPPNIDGGEGRNMNIVDVTGVHPMVVHFCRCIARKADFEQLLDAGIYPSSMKQPRTAFTFAVLDNFHITNLEFKTNTREYYQMIRRATHPAFLHQTMKWNGFGHGPYKTPGPRELALWCAACPVPGINLPDNWKEDEQRKGYLYTRILNLDGNMKVEQMTQKYVDSTLTDGGGFMVTDRPYQDSIHNSVEIKEKATCNNLRAVSMGNMSSEGLQVTGIGAAACGRHGAFCPHLQWNMDYALVQAAWQTMGGRGGLSHLTSLYDINCQFAVNLLRRIAANRKHLSLAKGIEIVHGISLFHIHGHQDSCTPRYSPNYIPSAGQVDGEVIETLWAPLNWIASSCRNMGNNHRAETLDIHMNDSNWKKLLNIVLSLSKKYVKALGGVQMSAEAFENICKGASKKDIITWGRAEAAAQAGRLKDITKMDIYGPSIKDAPTKAELQIQLTVNKESGNGPIRGSASWISNGMRIQEVQLELAAEIRKLGCRPTAAKRNNIEDCRRRLRD
ncbi:hypothetical protein JAAARDRAFT_200858 [Jaapia argillacea MUCL 33604]|uniref:CxC2-like cysteine cluster KDZ transposase-associated domain-containing protein n=1 Tax=Jaapia argillacea MUCL 33604 TaxID=933084 RepID=A0A067P6K7_9AGAM|nr:hypothetical protein JAAARDRAFT_200858 [Jaapia argillacea MUCL 33604]